MKKLLALLLSFMMVLTLVSAAVAEGADFTMTIEGGDVKENMVPVNGRQLLKVDVTLSGTVNDTLTALTFDLTFDPAQIAFVEMERNEEAFNSSVINDKEDGIKVERTVISPRYLTDEEEAAKFVGVKVGDTFVFNPHKANNGNIAELAAMLNVDRSEADVKSDFRVTIEEIKVNQEAEMNEEFFKGVLGTETDVKDEAAFREAVRAMIAQANVPESNYRFTVDVQRILTDKAGEMPLPEEFLKRFLKLRREQDEKENTEVTDEEAQNMFKSLRWQLVKDHLAQELGIQVEKEDIDTAAFIFAQQQLSQYGIYNALDDLIRQQAERYMQDDRAREMIQEHAIDNKFFAAVKESVKVNEKTISVDDFRKLYEQDEKK